MSWYYYGYNHYIIKIIHICFEDDFNFAIHVIITSIILIAVPCCVFKWHRIIRAILFPHFLQYTVHVFLSDQK